MCQEAQELGHDALVGERRDPPGAIAPRAEAFLSIVIVSSLLTAAGAPARDVRDLLRAARVLAAA